MAFTLVNKAHQRHATRISKIFGEYSCSDGTRLCLTKSACPSGLSSKTTGGEIFMPDMV